MIAAEGLAAVGRMIAAYRSGDGAATNYEIAWVTVALRDLRVRGDAWVRMARAHLRLWTDVVRRAQPGVWRRPRPRSPWRTVVNLRSWRDAIPTIYPPVDAVAPSAMTQARSGAVRSAVGQLYTVIKHVA
jgi:hypothetical protein